MRIYTVAVYVEKPGKRAVVYVGDAIELNGSAWLVLTWDSDDKLHPTEKLPLDEDRLVRRPPPDTELKTDWHYLVQVNVQETLQ